LGCDIPSPSRTHRFRPNKSSKSWFFSYDDDEAPYWDRCEYLRRALLESFVEFNWKLEYFFEAVKETDTLKRVVKFANKSDAGQRVLVDLLKSPQARRYLEHARIINKALK